MSEIDITRKYELVRTAQPSNIPQAGGYRGVGRNPDSNIPEAKPRSGLSRNTSEVRDKRKVVEPFSQPAATPGDSAADTCNSFNLYTETVGSTVKLMVGAGQIGTQYFAGKELGTLSLKHGHIVYLEVDLDGTNGTYTVDVKTAATFPTDGSPTKAYFSIGTISATGAVTQQMCGNFMVNVCRNWFTATAPFYNMSISGISVNYFNQ